MVRKTRRNTRIDCEIQGKVLGRHGYARGTVHNLSTGGLFFAGRHLSVGERTELQFALDGHFIHATCEVLYRQGHAEGQAGIGVRFLRLEPKAVELIQRYLAAHPAAPA